MAEWLDRWIEVVEVIRRNRLRTGLTMLGVFWGMFMLLLMVGFGSGLEQGVQGTLRGSVTNAVFVWGQTTSLPHGGMQPGREVDFTNGDIDALKQIPGVDIVAPRNMLGGFRSRGRRYRRAAQQCRDSGGWTVRERRHRCPHPQTHFQLPQFLNRAIQIECD